jgi:hypothetical protein
MTCLHTQLGQNIERLRTEYAAASTPAGRFPTSATTDSARRGQEHEWSEGPWKHPAPAPQPTYLARYSMAWIVVSVTWMTAASLIAWIAGGGADKAFQNISQAFHVERLNH